MVANRPGVLVSSCVGSGVTLRSWVVLNTTCDRVVLTTTRGRVGLVARVGTRVGLSVVRGDCVDAVVGRVMIIRGRVSLGVCGRFCVVGLTDGPSGFLGGGVVFSCVGCFAVWIICRIGPKRIISW